MMNVEITGEKENPLLKRKEIEFVIRYSGPTPSRTEVRDKLVAVLSSDKKLTILDSYNTEFGTNTLKGVVKVYHDEKSLKAEPKHMLVRNFEEREKKEPAPAAEAAEEPKSPESAGEEDTKQPEEPAEESKEESEPPEETEPPAEESK